MEARAATTAELCARADVTRPVPADTSDRRPGNIACLAYKIKSSLLIKLNRSHTYYSINVTELVPYYNFTVYLDDWMENCNKIANFQ